jgi:hypothetical protein
VAVPRPVGGLRPQLDVARVLAEGRWIAATASANAPQSPPGHGVRSLWLLPPTAAAGSRLTDASDAAYEVPRWSADGRFVMVVKRGLDPASPGAEVLISIDPSSGNGDGRRFGWRAWARPGRGRPRHLVGHQRLVSSGVVPPLVAPALVEASVVLTRLV